MRGALRSLLKAFYELRSMAHHCDIDPANMKITIEFAHPRDFEKANIALASDREYREVFGPESGAISTIAGVPVEFRRPREERRPSYASYKNAGGRPVVYSFYGAVDFHALKKLMNMPISEAWETRDEWPPFEVIDKQ